MAPSRCQGRSNSFETEYCHVSGIGQYGVPNEICAPNPYLTVKKYSEI